MADVAKGVVAKAQDDEGRDDHHQGMKVKGFVDMALGEGEGGAGEAAAGAGMAGDDGKGAERGANNNKAQEKGADEGHAEGAAKAVLGPENARKTAL